jgi:CDGSH-type Zn-finger protein
MSDLNPDGVAVAPAATETDVPGRSFFWCKCGRSFARPFCDGTHSGGCCRRDDHAESEMTPRTAA